MNANLALTRESTRKLLELIEEGLLDKDLVINACLSYMSEDEVKDLCQLNEFFDFEDLEEEE